MSIHRLGLPTCSAESMIIQPPGSPNFCPGTGSTRLPNWRHEPARKQRCIRQLQQDRHRSYRAGSKYLPWPTRRLATGNRRFESISLHRRVTANPLFTNLSEGTKARACKEVQSTRSSKTPSPQAAFAGKLPATSFAKSGIARARARPGRELTKRGAHCGANLALARRSSLKSEQCSPWR